MPEEKNECSKLRPKDNPYETWKGFGFFKDWEWRVLKKYQIDDLAPGAKYRCFVISPTSPKGKIEDFPVWEIKKYGIMQDRKPTIVIDLEDIDIMIPPFPF